MCGASKGLGFGCAQALVREGVNVVIVARGAEALEAAAARLAAPTAGRPAEPCVQHVAADITTAEGRAAAFALHRDFDIVVTNAGGPPPGDFRDWDREAWIKAVDANMLTPIELIKATVDGMAARGFGRIVNITSSAVKAPIDILGLSQRRAQRPDRLRRRRGAHRQAGSANVTINNLLPGAFDTDRLKGTMVGAAQEDRQADRGGRCEPRRRPFRRGASARRRSSAPTCAFLCSLHAGYITGQNVLTDGGAYPGTY